MKKMKTKGYGRGGKTKMAMGGGMMKSKGMKKGGKTEKLRMVEKDGEMVPFFLADDNGMAAGGKVPKSKGYFKGGKVMKSKMSTKGGKRGGI